VVILGEIIIRKTKYLSKKRSPKDVLGLTRKGGQNENTEVVPELLRKEPEIREREKEVFVLAI
jgi:hypothetical protein